MSAQHHPEVFGEYLLVGHLATTQMSEVMLAVRLGDRDGRLLAIKRAPLGEPPSGRAAQGIIRETEVLSAVRGPAIIGLEGSGEVGGLPFVALEYVRGVSLDALIAAHGPLDPDSARAVAVDLARALGALHAAGWVHGDVAPSNVLVDDAGECRLIDYGVAARSGSARRDVAGKPGYIAPEVARGVAAHPAEDVYGWGVVVAECLAGKRLFPERDLAEAPAREAGRAVAKLEMALPSIGPALAREPAVRPDAKQLAQQVAQGAVARETLARAVASLIAGGSASLGQPVRAGMTVPDVSPIPAAIAVRGESNTLPDGLVAAMTGPSPPSSTSRAGSGPMFTWSQITVVLIALMVALGLGGVVGRLSAHGRGGSLMLMGTLHRRAEVLIDGKLVKVPTDGSPIPLAAGKHMVTVVLPKGDHRDFPVQIRPGERIVVVPMGKGGVLPDPSEEK